MTVGSLRKLFMTADVPNRVLIPVLKSGAGDRLGRRFAVVEYLGRRTGRRHKLVTQYVREGRTVRIRVGMAQRKTWWRNFEQAHPLRIRLAGVSYVASAHVVCDRDQVSVIAELPSVDCQ